MIQLHSSDPENHKARNQAVLYSRPWLSLKFLLSFAENRKENEQRNTEISKFLPHLPKLVIQTLIQYKFPVVKKFFKPLHLKVQLNSHNLNPQLKKHILHNYTIL